MEGKESSASPVQSLNRALDILEAVATAEQGSSLSELAQICGLAPSTTHRLLKSLEQRRYVVHDEERGRWSVGVQAFTIGNAFLRGRNLVSVARPTMRRLMEQAGETVNLAVEDQGEAVFLAQVECRELMRAFSRPGGRAPLHCSGVGKALLAARPDLAKRMEAAGLESLTPRTITDPAHLERELENSRVRGYAIDDEEHAIGLRCVGTAIRDDTGEPVAALSISGPSARIPDQRLHELGTLVEAAAEEISLALGWHRSGARRVPQPQGA